MSKQRKLQSEIDQTLKRISEGVAEWDKLWDKLEETEDASQRDKIVQEMKKELKKLQRLREQVRGWAAGGEVKDDSRLMEARRLVEREMERFKYLEKEIKIKQFSSEGLMRDSTDPAMMAKVKTADWLSDMVAQLETQVEQLEADIEALGPQKGKTKAPRLVELETFIQRHQDHITRLEQCLRLLENDQVTPEEVEGAIKDGVEYYLQSGTEADYLPDETLYDPLPLKDVDDSIGKITPHVARAPSKAKAEAGDADVVEAAPEGGKSKRGKGSKGAKGKGDGGKDKGSGAGKVPIVPPPGLHAPPPSPAASGTPTAAARAASFKEAAAAGIRPAVAGSPTKRVATGGPNTPAPVAQDGAAITPAAAQRQQRTEGAGKPGSPSAKAASATPPAAVQALPAGAATAGRLDADQPAPPAAAVLPASAPEAAPAATPATLLALTGPVLQPLSPDSAACQAGYHEEMLLPAAAQHAGLTSEGTQRQGAPLPQQQHELLLRPPFLPSVQRLPVLGVVGVPAGLPPVSLASTSSLGGNGHSPFAALANGIAAAAGSPMAHDFNLTTPPTIGHSMEAHSASYVAGADFSPRSVQSSISGSNDAESQLRMPSSDVNTAAITSHRSESAAGHVPAGDYAPSHLSSQPGSVQNLAADDSMLAGGSLLGLTVSMMGDTLGVPHPTSQQPWLPTLADLQALEASMLNRPHPGDADWRLADGGVSSAGGPAPAQRPVVTPASFPNMVHPSLRREETWRKLSAETSLFNFYFQQFTRQQLFGANALKTQGWRFHTQFNAWFARQSQPRVVTDTHEQGPLVYFDSLLHNVTPATGLASQPVYSGWCPRVSRPDFIFEYRFMEQDDTTVPSSP